MSCASFRTPKAVCGWCARWPSRRTRTGSERPATSTSVIGKSRRKRLYGPWAPDGGRARRRSATRGSAPLRARHQPEPFAELDAHNSQSPEAQSGLIGVFKATVGRDPIWPELYELRNRLAQGDSLEHLQQTIGTLGQLGGEIGRAHV